MAFFESLEGKTIITEIKSCIFTAKYVRKLSLMDDVFKVQLCDSLFLVFLMALKVTSNFFSFAF